MKWLALSILVLFAGSIAALRALYATGPSAAPAAALAGPAVSEAPPAPADAAPPRAGAPLAAPAEDEPARARELALRDCVERRLGAQPLPDAAQATHGRWPAVKRAREALRLRRLGLRAACERELGSAP